MLAVMSTLTTIAALLLAYLRERDKHRHDEVIRAHDVALQKKDLEIADLTRRMGVCEGDCHQIKEEAQNDRERREQAEIHAAQVDGQLAAAERELHQLRDEVGELRDRLYGVPPPPAKPKRPKKPRGDEPS